LSEKTLPGLFEESVKKFPDNILIWENKTGRYEGTTYTEAYHRVLAFTAGLQAMGMQKGDRVALISEGRKDWAIAELAVLYAGAINVPISVKIDEPNDLKFRLLHSGCKFAIVSVGQLAKIKAIKNDLPELQKCIILDEVTDYGKDEFTMDEIIDTGETYLKAHRIDVESRRLAIRKNDYANICYTSGTTADPKGILLTHRNYTSNVEQACSLLHIPEDFVSLLILPLDHAFAHTVGIYMLMKCGAALATVQNGKTNLETLRNLPANIRDSKPSFLLSVPSLAKSFRRNIEKGIRDKGTGAWRVFNFALEIAYKYNGLGFDRGKGLKKLHYPMYQFFNKLFFRKIRESFGGRLEFFVGGGALLDIELQKFFYAIGIPMYQGYGLTEAAPIISSNVPVSHKLGSSGKIVHNLELQIWDDNGNVLPAGKSGEIVVKGENVMAGYWKNDKATAETIKDGWLLTGDLGYLDEDNFLYVLGRSKSLLIANDGEKYSPEGIEEAITECSPFIDQIMLYNDQSPYTTALVVPNHARLLEWLRQKQLDFKSETGQIEALRKIDSEIEQFKDGGKHAGMFPQRWLPATFAILGDSFNEENHFMNSTMKMVRGKITRFYKDRLDYLYTPEGKDVCNVQNKTIIGRVPDIG
jgi:long-chain acyl-CoA synthetase